MELIEKHLKKNEKGLTKFLKLWESVHPNSKI